MFNSTGITERNKENNAINHQLHQLLYEYIVLHVLISPLCMSITKNHEEKIDYLILIGISRGNGNLSNIILMRHAEN